MKIIKDFWKNYGPRTTVCIYLKSGGVMRIKCRNFTAKYDGDELQGYNVDGMNKEKILYLRIRDVAAISYK